MRESLKSYAKALYGIDSWIPKSELKDGYVYDGWCRNTRSAIWDKKKEVFFYHDDTRDEINHPEDDDGFDLFFPVSIQTKDFNEVEETNDQETKEQPSLNAIPSPL